MNRDHLADQADSKIILGGRGCFFSHQLSPLHQVVSGEISNRVFNDKIFTFPGAIMLVMLEEREMFLEAF